MIAHGQASDPAAAVAARSGGHFDPQLAAAFDAGLLDGLDDADALELALASEPAPAAVMPQTRIAEFAAAAGDFADLKCFWSPGHTRAVAELAGEEVGIAAPPARPGPARRCRLRSGTGPAP